MELFSLTPDEYKAFLLILTRVSTILFLFPFFGSPSFPAIAKTGLSLALTLFLFPVIEIDTSIWPESATGIAILGASEFIVGLILSMSVRIFVAAAQMAGQLAGFQLGFLMINIMDPQSGSQVSVIYQLFYWIVPVIFIEMGGHHIILSSVVESFSVLKPGTLFYGTELALKLVEMPAGMFVLGIKMSAPIMTSILLIDASFGIMTKFAPQMNILTVAFPVKITVGLFMSGVAMGIFILACKSFISGLAIILKSFMVMMGGT